MPRARSAIGWWIRAVSLVAACVIAAACTTPAKPAPPPKPPEERPRTGRDGTVYPPREAPNADSSRRSGATASSGASGTSAGAGGSGSRAGGQGGAGSGSGGGSGGSGSASGGNGAKPGSGGGSSSGGSSGGGSRGGPGASGGSGASAPKPTPPTPPPPAPAPPKPDGGAGNGAGDGSKGGGAGGAGSNPGAPAPAGGATKDPGGTNPFDWLGVGNGASSGDASGAPAPGAAADVPPDPALPQVDDPSGAPTPSAAVTTLRALAALRGGWIQVSDGTLPNHADYAPGGYAGRLMVIRDLDHVMLVACAYGMKDGARVSGTLRVQVEREGQLHISPPLSGDKPFQLLPRGASAPTQATVDVPTQIEGGRLRVGDKVFRRADEAEVRAFLSGGALPDASAKPDGAGTLLGDAWPGGPLLMLMLSPSKGSAEWSSTCRELRSAFVRAPEGMRVCVLAPGSLPGGGYRWREPREPSAQLGLGLAEANCGQRLDAAQVASALASLGGAPGAVLILTASPDVPDGLAGALGSVKAAVQVRLLPGVSDAAWVRLAGADAVRTLGPR